MPYDFPASGTYNGWTWDAVKGAWQVTIPWPAGGLDTQVQFNDGGALAGNAGLTFSKVDNTLTLNGIPATNVAALINVRLVQFAIFDGVVPGRYVGQYVVMALPSQAPTRGPT